MTLEGIDVYIDISSLTKIYGKGLCVSICLYVFACAYRTEITTPVWKIDHNNTFHFGALVIQETEE